MGQVANPPVPMSALVWCALAWMGWCALHSGLAGTALARPLERVFTRYYRLFYNAFSALSIWPIWLYTDSLRGDELWTWSGWLRPLQALLWLVACGLFYGAARRYDMKAVAGWVPTGRGIAAEGLDTGGVLAHLRHPWYLAFLLVIWGRDMALSDVVISVVLSAYIGVGTLLEERKLARAYGEIYRCYQRRVPMLFPWKWPGRLWRTVRA